MSIERQQSATTRRAGKPVRRRLVLLVDDSRAQRRMLAIQIERAGYEVAEAANAEEALAFCQARPPDFIISDWVMPGVSGPEFCLRLRAAQQNAYSFFILLTSKSETAEIAYGLEAGADDFLKKPVAAAELLARMHAGARILQLQEDAREANSRLSATLDELRRTQAAMDRDLTEARRLQQGLVRERSGRFGPFRADLLLRPAGQVGGDLVGYFPIDSRRFGMYAIDVAGHGVAAALLVARLATQFSSSLDHGVALTISDLGIYGAREPVDLALYLNHLMLTDLRTDTYFTLIYAIVDTVSGLVRFVQAGHPHPVVQRSGGEVEWLGRGGLPIGLLPDADYEECQVTLGPGDRLLVVSDGISEAVDGHGNLLGEDGLQAFLTMNRHHGGQGFMESLCWSVAAFTSGRQDDDISAVLLERDAG